MENTNWNAQKFVADNLGNVISSIMGELANNKDITIGEVQKKFDNRMLTIVPAAHRNELRWYLNKFDYKFYGALCNVIAPLLF